MDGIDRAVAEYDDFWENTVYGSEAFKGMDEDAIDDVVFNLGFTGDLSTDELIWEKVYKGKSVGEMKEIGLNLPFSDKEKIEPYMWESLDPKIFADPIASGLLQPEDRPSSDISVVASSTSQGVDSVASNESYNANSVTDMASASPVMQVEYNQFFDEVLKSLPDEFQKMNSADLNKVLGFTGCYEEDAEYWKVLRISLREYNENVAEMKRQYPGTYQSILEHLRGEVRAGDSENYFASLNGEIDYFFDRQYNGFMEAIYTDPVFDGKSREQIDEVLADFGFTGDLELDRIRWENGKSAISLEPSIIDDEEVSDTSEEASLDVVDASLDASDADYSAFYLNVYDSKCLPPECANMSKVEIDEYLGFTGDYEHDVALWGTFVKKFAMGPFAYIGNLSSIVPEAATSLFTFTLKKPSKSGYKAKYNDNVISYDVENTESAIGRINQALNDFDNYLTKIEAIQKVFSGISNPYSKYSGIPKLSSSINNIRDDIKTSYDEWIKKIEKVRDDIIKYSEGGEFSDTLKGFLSIETTPDEPVGGPSGTPNGGGNPSGKPNDGNLGGGNPGSGQPDPDLGSESNDKNNDMDDSNHMGDEKIEIPIINSGVGSPNSSHITSTTFNTSDEPISSDLPVSGSVGTSLNNSSNRFIIPSIGISADSSNNTDNSVILGTAGIVAAATVAVGGKLYYDKKNGNDKNTKESNEEPMDLKNSKNSNIVEETKSALS